METKITFKSDKLSDKELADFTKVISEYLLESVQSCRTGLVKVEVDLGGHKS